MSTKQTPELPEWEYVENPPTRKPDRNIACKITNRVNLTIELPQMCSSRNAAHIFAWVDRFVPNDANIETRKHMALLLLVDKLEEALPVMRGLLEASETETEKGKP